MLAAGPLRAAAALAALGLALAPGATAGPDDPEGGLARLLAADTLGAVVVEDTVALAEALSATPVAAFFREPDVEAIVDEVKRTIAEDLALAEEGLGFRFDELRALGRAEAIYAITGVGLPSSNPVLHRQVAVIRPADAAALPLWRRLEERLVQDLRARVPGLVEGEGDLAGVVTRTLSKDGAVIHRALVDGHIVLGTDATAVGRAIEGLRAEAAARAARASAPRTGPGSPSVGGAAAPASPPAAAPASAARGFFGPPRPQSLAEHPSFQAVRRETLAGLPGAFAYFNVEELLGKAAVRAALDDAAEARLAALGVSEVKAVGLGAAVSGDGFRDALYVLAPRAISGYHRLQHAFPPGAPFASAGRAPRDAFLFVAARPRPTVLYHVLREVHRAKTAAADPEAPARVDRAVRTLEAELGKPVARLLEPFGGELGLYATMPDGGEGIYPEVVAQLELRDAAAAEAVLAGVIARFTRPGPDWPALDIRELPRPGGGRFHYWNLGRLGGQTVIEPAWAIEGRWLVIAATPIHLKRALERLAATPVAPAGSAPAAEAGGASARATTSTAPSSGPGAPLAGSPAFEAAAARLPAGARAVGFLDTGKIARGLYNTYGPFFQAAADKGDLPFEPGLLPSPSALARHLDPAALWVAWDAEGIRLELRSPVSPFALFAIGAGSEALKQARQRAAEARVLDGGASGAGGAGAAAPEAPPVRLAFRDAPLADALERVCADAGASVFLPRERLAGRLVTLDAGPLPLGEALTRLLAGTGLRARERRLPDGALQVVIYDPAAPGG